MGLKGQTIQNTCVYTQKRFHVDGPSVLIPSDGGAQARQSFLVSFQFQFLKSPSTPVVSENVSVLFGCEASEIFHPVFHQHEEMQTMTQSFKHTANKIYLSVWIPAAPPLWAWVCAPVVSLDSRQLQWIPACCTDGEKEIKLHPPSHTHKNYQNIVSDRILFCLCMLCMFQTLSWRRVASISNQTQNPFVLFWADVSL